MRSRQILLAVLSASLLLNTSCLDIDEISDVSDSNATRSTATAEDLDNLSLLVYEGFFRMLQLNGYNVPGWGGDDITTLAGEGKKDFRQFDVREVPANHPRMSKYLDDTAVITSRIGEVLALSESILASFPGNPSEEEQLEIDKISLISNEMLFLRSLSFHQTLRMFGKVPLTFEQFVPASTLSGPLESYLQIEEDLKLAIEGLPDIYPGLANPGARRPNKGSARALLARVYMDWAGFPVKDQSKYALAAEQAKLVIDNKAAHGFDLMENAGDLWLEANRFNKESVFLFAFNKALGQDNRKYGQVAFPSQAPFNGWEETFSEIRFFEDFPEQPRKDATYIRAFDRFWPDFQSQGNPIFAKVGGPRGDLALGAFATERSDFWIRFADVLLMHAEASARSGNANAAAWESLNQVRRRAEGLPFETPDPTVDLTSGDLAELTVTERKWELAGEYLRWYDLVRLELVAEALATPARTPRVSRNRAGELLTLRNPVSVGDLSTNNYFAPIPPEIIAKNPGFAN